MSDTIERKDGKGREEATLVEDEKIQSLTTEELFVNSSSEEEKKKVLLKMDIRILPVLVIFYVMSFIDRANIGNAKIEGMVEDLRLSSTEYNVVLSIFFVTYIIFEMPSNYILERYFRDRPSWWIGIITVLWGVFMVLHGIAKDYGSIVAVRLLMGVFEAGLFPGALLFMNKWYTKFELATRFSIFYVGSALSGAFSGLLAYAFAQMGGIAGVEGWRWTFIMEGIITVVIGVAVPFLLADTPTKAHRWLDSRQRKYIIDRMVIQDGGEEIAKAGSHFSFSLLWDVVSDWQFYLMVFNYWSNTIPTYGMKFTMPQIMKNMGYTNNTAQLLTIPPYVAGAISAYCFGCLSDKFRRRSYFLIIPQAMIIIAYSIMTPLAPRIKENIGVCYFTIMLANIGLYPLNPGASSWVTNNLAGSAKRALGIAYMTSLTNVSGIVGSFIFIDSEKPAYPTGFGVSLAAAPLGVIASMTLDLLYIRINKKREQILEEEVREIYTNEQLAALGNHSPLFRCTLYKDLLR